MFLALWKNKKKRTLLGAPHPIPDSFINYRLQRRFVKRGDKTVLRTYKFWVLLKVQSAREEANSVSAKLSVSVCLCEMLLILFHMAATVALSFLQNKVLIHMSRDDLHYLNIYWFYNPTPLLGAGIQAKYFRISRVHKIKILRNVCMFFILILNKNHINAFLLNKIVELYFLFTAALLKVL